jgi:hypothetical protein
MANNPINLAARFALEILALIAMGYWGWRQGDGAWRYLLALGVPLLAAALWGIFRVPGDPGEAPVAVPGVVRLVLEAAFFSFAVWALGDVGADGQALALGALVVVHYLISYDRVIELLRYSGGRR